MEDRYTALDPRQPRWTSTRQVHNSQSKPADVADGRSLYSPRSKTTQVNQHQTSSQFRIKASRCSGWKIVIQP